MSVDVMDTAGYQKASRLPGHFPSMSVICSAARISQPSAVVVIASTSIKLLLHLWGCGLGLWVNESLHVLCLNCSRATAMHEYLQGCFGFAPMI